MVAGERESSRSLVGLVRSLASSPCRRSDTRSQGHPGRPQTKAAGMSRRCMWPAQLTLIYSARTPRLDMGTSANASRRMRPPFPRVARLRCRMRASTVTRMDDRAAGLNDGHERDDDGITTTTTNREKLAGACARGRGLGNKLTFQSGHDPRGAIRSRGGAAARPYRGIGISPRQLHRSTRLRRHHSSAAPHRS